MIAVDTNILVRLITDEPPQQAERAGRFLEQNDIFVPLTVVLEAEWVLRSRVGLSRAQAVDAIEAFSRLPSVKVEHARRVSKALAWSRAGMDLADALHLASAEDCEALATFDRKFRKQAIRLDVAPPVVEP